MKNLIKNGLFAILFAVSLVSCSPVTGNKGSSDGGSGNGSEDAVINLISNETSCTYNCVQTNDETFTLSIIPSGSGFLITMRYYKSDVTFTSGYFTEIKLDGAAKGITTLYPGSGVFQGLQNIESKAVMLNDYIPSTDTWKIIFSNSTDSSKNVSHTIAAKYVTQIKTWINGR